ncbi:MAG: NAD(P)H-dependent oxidoreductase [Dysgonomonas sp.]
MTILIWAHPWHGSFGKVILDTVTAKYDKDNTPYEVIDLNKDGFNPVMVEAELALYSRGQSVDPLVKRYQDLLRQADRVVFLFPIWWGTMPAILKGFFDKVFIKDFAFNYENGWTALLNPSKTTVITTSESPTAAFENSIAKSFIPNMLESVGLRNAEWHNCEYVSHGTKEHRQDFLKKIKEVI